MAVQAEWLEKDYYAVLGVAETAGEKDIRRAYRRLARQYHPDANPGDPKAEERFKEVAAAYEVVGDAARRTEYDQARQLAAMPGGFGPSPGAGGRSYVFTGDDLAGAGFDLGDLFGGLFGAGAGGPFADAGARPRRGRDLEAELTLRFEDAAAGTTTEMGLPGRPPVRVRVPAGVRDGQLVRVPGQGQPGPDGGPAGDLFVAVRVAPHRLFGRDGADLTLSLPVTYPEAVLGTAVRVPTLDGAGVTLRVPPGTPSGRTLRVRGRGVPRARGGRGDLLVTVEVAVPAEVTGAEREAVEALAATMTAGPRDHLAA